MHSHAMDNVVDPVLQQFYLSSSSHSSSVLKVPILFSTDEIICTKTKRFRVYLQSMLARAFPLLLRSLRNDDGDGKERHKSAHLINKNNGFCMRYPPRTCVVHFREWFSHLQPHRFHGATRIISITDLIKFPEDCFGDPHGVMPKRSIALVKKKIS